MSGERELNLNIGINTTGYLPGAWKYRTGNRYDVADPGYFLRLTQLAHRGLFDAVFLSDMSALAMEPGGRPFHTLDPITLYATLAGQVPDIGGRPLDTEPGLELQSQRRRQFQCRTAPAPPRALRPRH
jgi:hypothetical protein